MKEKNGIMETSVELAYNWCAESSMYVFVDWTWSNKFIVGFELGLCEGFESNKQSDVKCLDNIVIHRHMDRQVDRQARRQSDKPTDIKADRQTDRQTDHY